MTGRRAIVGLCMLCALLVSAVAAQGAIAATGTTAFTCKKPEGTDKPVGEKFSKEHCKEADTSPTGEYRHVEIPNDKTTELTGSNEETSGTTRPTKLHSVISGIEVELESPTVTGTGWMTNAFDAVAEEHYAHGEGTIEYKEVVVKKPAGKGCKVKTGVVKTNKLKATTKGAAMGLKFEPAEGGVFATFEVEGCGESEALKALNGVYEVKGSVIGTPDGATTVFERNPTTAQTTLKLRGQNAGIDGSLTLKARASSSESYKPLSATTTP
jgi:hypothetical protein